ncbi:hypothetical protein C1H46_023233 [Malus baccata]|uniref:Uncharacterized protein n=1 Tax=Malus baccata TaxID=106549 RepID=A0A540LY11_MALBA|nr:hypothetical protein C1H46_023233 [Malus baccata]
MFCRSHTAKWMGFPEAKYERHCAFRGLASYPDGQPFEPKLKTVAVAQHQPSGFSRKNCAGGRCMASNDSESGARCLCFGRCSSSGKKACGCNQVRTSISRRCSQLVGKR